MHVLRKKFVVLLIVILGVCLYTGVGFAKDTSLIELSASEQSDKYFEEVKYYSTGDVQTVIIKGSVKNKDDGIAVYDIELDLTNKTYTSTRAKGAELQSVIESLAMEKDFKLNSTMNTYSIGVTVLTVDPVNEPLCETGQMLFWSSDGTYSYFDKRKKFAWAANPTRFNTHWFVEEDEWGELRIIDLGRTVLSSNYASYYNFDFGLPNSRTDVYHKITIEGYRTGDYEIYTTYDASGEASYLLRFKVIEW